MDKWLLSKMNTMVKEVDQDLENYQIPEAARALQSFVDDMSNWYVRRSRERFWAGGMEQDKINAYETLYTALVTVAKAAAPMIPFMTEDIYRNLVCSIDSKAKESVHLCDFPAVNEAMIDPALEQDMDQVLKVVVMGRAARNAANIKNRQPIGRMFVKSGHSLPEFFVKIIEDELNVKRVEFTEDVREFTTYSFKPQLKTVGPKYGKLLNQIRTALAEIDGNAAMETLEEKGELTFSFGDDPVALTKDDLLIDVAQKEGFVTEEDLTVTVVLDTNLTKELLEEGFVRELISKLQTMRKEAGFEVTDVICAYLVSASESVSAMVEKNKEKIAGEVLAKAVETTREKLDEANNRFASVSREKKFHDKEWNINGEMIHIAVERH